MKPCWRRASYALHVTISWVSCLNFTADRLLSTLTNCWHCGCYFHIIVLYSLNRSIYSQAKSAPQLMSQLFQEVHTVNVIGLQLLDSCFILSRDANWTVGNRLWCAPTGSSSLFAWVTTRVVDEHRRGTNCTERQSADVTERTAGACTAYVVNTCQ